MKENDKALGELRQILPAPSSPVACCAAGDWSEIENKLGTPLPSDYREFIQIYGGCSLWDYFEILSPCGSATSLMKWHAQVGTVLEKVQSVFKAYPSPNGLLVFGADENANQYCWKTTGLADEWSIIVLSDDLQDHFAFEGCFAAFLLWLVQTPELPEFLSAIPFRTRPGPILKPCRA